MKDPGGVDNGVAEIQSHGKSSVVGTTEMVRVDEAHEGKRLDLFLSGVLGLTRSFTQKMIRMDKVTFLEGGGKVKAGLRVKPGQVLRIEIPPLQSLDLEPEPVPFDVVFEDPDLLVINKPGGVVVHPAPGNWTGTLVHGLLYRFPDIGNFNGVQRPGIVHRLDRGTSGLMVVARNPQTSDALISLFRERAVLKEYLALGWGCPESKRAEINAPIARDPSNRLRMTVADWGKPARTGYRLLWSRRRWSLFLCRLLTGRTHQIRVHLKMLGCPLVGDRLYAPERVSPLPEGRFFLHAWRLGFAHPWTGREMVFSRPLPQDLIPLLAGVSATDSGQS